MSASATAPAAPPRATRPRAARERALVLVPPEGVPLHLVLAPLGARVGAQFIDLVATILLAGLVGTALVYTGAIPLEAETAIASLLLLLVGTPFYVASELLMNGRTPGKRLVGIRVVSLDGAGLSTHQVVVRNLLKEVELFLPLQFLPLLALGRAALGLAVLAWTLVVIAVPLRTRARQRIGDVAAGTTVVLQPRARLLPDLAAGAEEAGPGGLRADPRGTDPRRTERFVFTTAQLDLYGAYELQVLERLLRARAGGASGGGSGGESGRASGGASDDALREVGASIRRKIGYEEVVAEAETETFLLAFYRAQRAYLEQKRLFGDARDDKFHRAARAAGGGPGRTGGGDAR